MKELSYPGKLALGREVAVQTVFEDGASGDDADEVAQIVDDGIQAKISQLTEDCQVKLQDTLQKIINDSNGGMICIII